MKKNFKCFMAVFLGVVIAFSTGLFTVDKAEAATGKDLILYYEFDGSIKNLTNYNVQTNITDGGRGATVRYGYDPQYETTDPTYLQWSGANTTSGGYQIQSIFPMELGAEYSIAMRFSLDTFGSWRKIVDYKNNSSDIGFYLYGNPGHLKFYDAGAQGPTTFSANQIVDLIAVRTADGRFRAYTNSSAGLKLELDVTGYESATIPYSSAGKSILGFLGDDTHTRSECSPGGKVYSIKVWNYALNDSDIEKAADPPAGDVEIGFVDEAGNPIPGMESIFGESTDEFTLPELPAGSDYNVWRTKGGKYYGPGDKITTSQSMKLYPAKVITVSFSSQYETFNNQYYLNGDTITNLPVSNDRHEFLGWYLSQDYSDKVTNGYRVTQTEDFTLYAKYDTSHKHDLSYEADFSTVYVSCDDYSESTTSCDIHDNGDIELSIGYENGKFVYDGLKRWNEIVNTPLPTIMYQGADDTEYPSSSVMPTEAGSYEAYALFTSPVEAIIYRGFTISDDGTVQTENAPEVYVPEDPSYINYDLGRIDYTPRDHVVIYAHELKDFEQNNARATDITNISIDLTDERFYAEGFYLKAYSINGGRTWKQATNEQFNEDLNKLFNKNLKLRIADTFDASTKKPTETSQIYAFMDIKKRPTITKNLSANYYLCRDDSGATSGQWVLMSGSSVAPMNLYEIGISDSTGKKLGNLGFGMWPGVNDGMNWPEYGGVWVRNLPDNGRAARDTYMYRIIARIDEKGYAVPSSVTRKVKVSTALPAPKVRVDYKNESIRLKKDMCIMFGELSTLPEVGNRVVIYLLNEEKLETVDDYYGRGLLNVKGNSVAVKKGIPISNFLNSDDREFVYVWTPAKAGKPATAIRIHLLAKRAPAPVSTAAVVKLSNGRAAINKDYEIFYEEKGKWVKSVPTSIKTDVSFRVRSINKAKSGYETNSMYASGDEAVLSLVWGVVDEKSGREGFIEASLEQ